MAWEYEDCEACGLENYLHTVEADGAILHPLALMEGLCEGRVCVPKDSQTS